MDPPRNRKQRRAAAAADTDSFDPSSIPLARPQTESKSQKSQKNERTLVDMIAERQGELGKIAGSKGTETKYVTVDPETGDIFPFDGTGLVSAGKSQASTEVVSNANQTEDQHEDDNPLSPIIDTLLLSIPLTVLHLTLGYLAAHQYAQKIELGALFRNSALLAFPMLTLLIHLSHGHIVSFNRGQAEAEDISLFPWHSSKLSFSFMRKLVFPPSFKTMVFLPAAILLGSKLIVMTNQETYYAVMKRAPAIGTLWVWCILEIPVGAAALGALAPLLWGVWWEGYGII
ncbi:hypothetical protein BJX99DRAFT_204352 [Aspergillus californicus]